MDKLFYRYLMVSVNVELTADQSKAFNVKIDKLADKWQMQLDDALAACGVKTDEGVYVLNVE